MKAKFKKFLEDNGVYDAFEKNLKEFKNISFDEYVNGEDDVNFLVGSGFSWGDSPEKYDFWDHINNLWIHINNLWLDKLLK